MKLHRTSSPINIAHHSFLEDRKLGRTEVFHIGVNHRQGKHLQQVTLDHVANLSQAIDEGAAATETAFFILCHHDFLNALGAPIETKARLNDRLESGEMLVHEERQPMIGEMEVIRIEARGENARVQGDRVIQRISAPSEGFLKSDLKFVATSHIHRRTTTTRSMRRNYLLGAYVSQRKICCET